MRIAIFSPFSTGPSRGNITTVNRIHRSLISKGQQVSIIPLDIADSGQIQELLDTLKPDIIHAFHCFYSGPSAQAAAARLSVPFIITITGSDLFDPAYSSHPDAISALESAAAVTCFDLAVQTRALEVFPFIEGKTAVISQGVEPLPASAQWPRKDSDFIILLPAAIRPAKGIIEAIDSLKPLSGKLPGLKLLLAGGELDTEYAATVSEKISTFVWVTALGDIPQGQMTGLYRASDIVLNSSIFEGGMPNSILEAMAAGTAVVARDIPGNGSLVRDGETGWLYRDGQELRNIVSMLAEKPGLRESAGRAAFKFAAESFSAAKEAECYLELYRSMI